MRELFRLAEDEKAGLRYVSETRDPMSREVIELRLSLRRLATSRDALIEHHDEAIWAHHGESQEFFIEDELGRAVPLAAV